MKNYGTDPKLDRLVDSDNWEDRAKVAEQGYGLDKLINDEDYFVRRAVARHGYGLDKLINDKNSSVRIAVTWQRYGLDKLVKDEDYMVRKAVAWQGYGLDILVYDENYEVRAAVDKYLAEHGLTIEEWCKQNKKSTSAIQNLKDFIHKVEDSSKIKIETSYESTDAFFEDTSYQSYENKESITIIAVNTKLPLVKLEKTKLNDKNVFKFIVDISNDEDNFIVKSIFDTKEKFDQLLHSTINSLHEYSQFSKYVDELEQCL